MKRLIASLIIPALLFGGTARAGVTNKTVTTSKIGASTPAKYVLVSTHASLTTVASGSIQFIVYPGESPGRLVDMIIYQRVAGTGGTSFTIDVKTSPGNVSLLSTLPVQTLASGADKFTDIKGTIALPSGWTRGVIKTDGTALVQKGAQLIISTVETGTYSPHAAINVVLVFEPIQ